jgi:hypothetical protein
MYQRFFVNILFQYALKHSARACVLAYNQLFVWRGLVEEEIHIQYDSPI